MLFILNNTYDLTNSSKIINNSELIYLYVLLANLIFLLVVILGFSFKIWYKKYIDNSIVI